MIAAQLALAGPYSASTAHVLTTLRDILLEAVREGAWELHIPDAPGVATEGHEFWRACRQRIVTHPSRADPDRPHLDCDETRPSLPARERALGLVSQCQALVYVAAEDEDYLGSGIVGAARRRGLAIVVVLPSGDVRQWSYGLAPIVETSPESPGDVPPGEAPDPDPGETA